MDLTKDFLEKMIRKLNPNIDEDELGFFVEDTEEVLWDFMMANIAEKLSDKQIDEFAEMVENDCSDEELMAYLKKHIPNTDAFLKKIYDEFEGIYVEEARKLESGEFEEENEEHDDHHHHHHK